MTVNRDDSRKIIPVFFCWNIQLIITAKCHYAKVQLNCLISLIISQWKDLLLTIIQLLGYYSFNKLLCTIYLRFIVHLYSLDLLWVFNILDCTFLCFGHLLSEMSSSCFHWQKRETFTVENIGWFFSKKRGTPTVGNIGWYREIIGSSNGIFQLPSPLCSLASCDFPFSTSRVWTREVNASFLRSITVFKAV